VRLTTQTDYALRLLMDVAQHPDRLCTIAEVAARQQVSEAHLMKVTHRLALGGWLHTVRGKGGGMRLAKAPRDICIGDVVRALEADFQVVECFSSGSACRLDGHCGLASALHQALDAFLTHLDGLTLADVATRPTAKPGQAAPVSMHHRRRPGPAAGT
jgi:Rrf2 family transcriptional regulator, nitric oxide-sensitive transcriptional repressor